MKLSFCLPLPKKAIIAISALALSAPLLLAQRPGQGQTTPHIGYVFPAGTQRGTTCEIVVGGQYLGSTKDIFVSGSGVKISDIFYHKPLNMKRLNELRDYLQEARKKFVETGKLPAGGQRALDMPDMISSILKEAGATDEEIKGFLEFRANRNDPKRQQNLQIAETVTIKVEVAPDAQLGPRELRVSAPNGMSNPLAFCIGQLPEPRVSGTLGKTADTAARVRLPAVLNGQILPGGIDHYSFEARKGARIVIAVQARDLIPYLADAVPGWFQPIAVLYDSKGKEVAYADDYKFNPDPTICCDIPETGTYVIEIKDALYRGREDFVYRVTVGEIPFVTSIYPLGGKKGAQATVDVSGWNFPRKTATLSANPEEGIHLAPELTNGFVITDVAFESDSLPEVANNGNNHDIKQAQRVKPPAIINGHITKPGEINVYAVPCKAGDKIVAEVTARRLNSPLDSWLRVTDEAGFQIAFNDDRDDKGSGLLTHQADSYLTFTAPASGDYYVYIGDSQHKGGPDYSYRLRISQPQPDFALRMVPSALNCRPGGIVPVTLYAMRKDGFAGDINLAVKSPNGFVLQGGCIPAGQDSVRATVLFPFNMTDSPVTLSVEGHSSIQGRDVSHPAVPADDMLQAFAYHHLVPAKELFAVKASNSPYGMGSINTVTFGEAKLPVKGEGHLIVPTGGRMAGIQPETKFELNDPPPGITLTDVTTTAEGISFNFKTDAKVKPGLRGNLMVEVFNERVVPGPGGGKGEKRRFPSGVLPAIPFSVAEK